MKLLLDTATFLFVVSGDGRLSSRAAAAIVDPENSVFLSSVSAWEIAVRHKAGQFALPGSPSVLIPEWRERHGIEALPLDEASALALTQLPDSAGDAFDRLLVSQAIQNGLTIVSPDETIRRFPVPLLW